MTVAPQEQEIVCPRVVSVLREWIEKCPGEFEANSKLRATEAPLVRMFERTGQNAAPIERAFGLLDHRAKLGGDNKGRAKMWGQAAPTPIVPLLPLSSSQFSGVGGYASMVLSIDPAELARQLTLIDQSFLQCLSEHDLLHGNFSNPLDATTYPAAFSEYIDWTQRLQRWVSFCILTSDSLRSRVKLFICFLECANHLRSMNNYNALVAIARGLVDPNVARLKQTIGAFHAKLNSIYQTISQLSRADVNYALLREAQEKAPKPMIPALITIIIDIVAAHSKPYVDPSTSRLQFHQLRQVSTIMDTIQRAQELSYPYVPVPSIKNMLLAIRPVITVEEMDQASQYLEPPLGMERGEKPRILLSDDEIRRAQDDTDVYRPQSPRNNGTGAEWAVSLGRDGLEFEVIFIPGYRFYSRDTLYNIRIEFEDGVALIRYAILEKLIEHLTPAKQHIQDDPDLLRVFFSTFHGFTTSHIVLELLAMRYQPPHLKSQDAAQIKTFQENYELPIRNRVCAVLQYWLRKHTADFANVSLRERLRDFLVDKVTPVQPDWGKLLLQELDSRVLLSTRSTRSGSGSSWNASGNRSSLKSNLSFKLAPGLAILDFEPSVVAMQLSVLIHEAWTRIRTSEMMNMAWIGPQAHSLSPNILTFLGLIDKVVYNIEVELTRLLNGTRHEILAKTIGGWLQVAQRCHEHLLCWPAAEAIVTVIQHCYTQELAPAWEKIPKQLVRYFHQSRSLFSDRDRYLDASLLPFSAAAISWRISTAAPLAMTAELAKSNPDALETPKLMMTQTGVLPLEIILDDISEIEETYPNLVLDMGPRVINFEKYRLMSEIFHLVMLTQRSDYNITKPAGYNPSPDPRVRAWLTREPRPDEIPAQRFDSRFAQRISIQMEDVPSAIARRLRRSTSTASSNADSNAPTPASSAAPSPFASRSPSISDLHHHMEADSSTSSSNVSPRLVTPSDAHSSSSDSSISPRVLSDIRASLELKTLLEEGQPRKTSLPPSPRLHVTSSTPVTPHDAKRTVEARSGHPNSRHNSPAPAAIKRYQSALINKKQIAPLLRSQTTELKSTSTLADGSQTARAEVIRNRPLPTPPDVSPSLDPAQRSMSISSTGPPSGHIAQSSPKRSATISDPSSAHIPRVLKVPSPEDMLRIIKENPTVLKNLLDDVMADAKKEIMSSPEVQAKIRIKKERENKLFLALERESKEGKKRQIQRMMRSKHPKMKFTSWRHLDKSGTVFGFEYPIVLELGIFNEAKPNEIVLCDLITNVDIADVSLFFRSGKLYKTLFPDASLSMCLLGDSFSQAATAAASKCNVQLLPIELPLRK